MQVKKRRPDAEIGALTLRHQQERADLEKNMTLRRDKKKESLTRKMLEHERYIINCNIFFLNTKNISITKSNCMLCVLRGFNYTYIP